MCATRRLHVCARRPEYSTGSLNFENSKHRWNVPRGRLALPARRGASGLDPGVCFCFFESSGYIAHRLLGGRIKQRMFGEGRTVSELDPVGCPNHIGSKVSAPVKSADFYSLWKICT